MEIIYKNVFDQLADREIRSNNSCNIRTARLLKGIEVVTQEKKYQSLKQRVIEILEDDENNISKKLNELINDDYFREQLEELSHGCNYEEQFHWLKHDNDGKKWYHVTKEAKGKKKRFIIKKRRPDKKLKYNECININPILWLYNFIKKIDSQVELEMLNILKSERSNGSDFSTYKRKIGKLYNHLKKYRIFLPIFICTMIAVILLPQTLFVSIAYGTFVSTTFGSFTMLYTLFNVSLFLSFLGGIYYQIKYSKCKKIMKYFRTFCRRNKFIIN
ncbi:Pv-fam-d protein [Plasmodium ovale wallikeri]|uniref:Pv-fam-d protein n=2 Tax=Plasmodium ovale TaxID=36330 RepID=A0A1A9AMH5_PLAOA|nr:Pv-fam-d protein [Plasmodium ovale wallikeri]SBT57618.1 Pv-fam-d protein [Plasmodium ovale wallikeri]SBT75763.1 Plasmodium exported protein, unknown function [Plasmodium ovale]